MESARGPLDYAASSQARRWTFDPASLASLRARANEFANLRAAEHLASGRRPDAEALTPRCLPAEGAAHDPPTRKRGRDEGAGPSSSVLSAEEELVIVSKYRSLLLDKWVAKLPALSYKIGSSAVVFFSRFFLSNSVLEYDPLLIALASVLVASKAEGTWGFVPALELNGVRAERDDSITQVVPLRVSHARGRFALVSSEAAGEGSFFCVGSDPDPVTTARRVLDAELQLLQGINFDLFLAHPLAPLRGLMAALEPASDATLDAATTAPVAPSQPPPPVSSSAAVPPAPPTSSAEPATGAQAAAFNALGGKARAHLRRAVTSDLPFLFPPALLALGALFLAAEEMAARPLGLDGGEAAVLARLRTRPEFAAALTPAAVARAGEVRAHLRSLASTKTKSRPFKDAMEKLNACALWRERNQGPG